MRKKASYLFLILLMSLPIMLSSCSSTSSSIGKSNSACADYDDTFMWVVDHSDISDYYIYPFNEEEDWIGGRKLILYKKDGEMYIRQTFDIGALVDNDNHKNVYIEGVAIEVEGLDNVYYAEGEKITESPYFILDNSNRINRIIGSSGSIVWDYEYDEDGNVSTRLIYKGDDYYPIDVFYDLEYEMPAPSLIEKYYYDGSKLSSIELYDTYHGTREVKSDMKTYNYDGNGRLTSIEHYEYEPDDYNTFDSLEEILESSLTITDRDSNNRLCETFYENGSRTYSTTVEYYDDGSIELTHDEY